MKAARTIDSVVSDRVIVFGSLPPDGRDLDLLVKEEQRGEIRSALARAGFFDRKNQWVSFEGAVTESVDVIPAEDWRLTQDALDDLFSQARSISGYEKLVRPAPHHALLILARRMVRAGGELDPKKRERISSALNEDPEGWAHSQEAAGGWSSLKAVVALERLYKTGVPTSPKTRVAALVEQGIPSARAGRIVSRTKRTNVLVTFSGLDGSGKTSQAEALKASLEKISGDTVIVWTRLSYNPSLKALARPIKALLRGKASNPSGDASPIDDRGKELRKKSPVVTQLWATAVALTNAAAQRRVTSYHMKRGRNVVSDRYTFDSRVHLRYRYGTDRSFRFQTWIIERLSPTPLRSFLVDVPPEEAFARKAEQYDLEQLRTQAALYRDELSKAPVKRLDGTRPKDELAQEVAKDVWDALD